MTKRILAFAGPFVAALIFAASSQAYLNLANAKLVFAYESQNLANLYYGNSGTVEQTPYSCTDLGYANTDGSGNTTTCWTRTADNNIYLLQSRLVNGAHRYFHGYERGSNECMLTGIDISTWTFTTLHDHSPFRWYPDGCFG